MMFAIGLLVTTSSARAQSGGSDCVWSAAGGSVVGLGVAWYGYAGIEALRGKSAYDLEANPGNVTLILGLETAGMVGGAMLGCRLFGDEDRWFPTAGSIIVGGVVGGAALGGAAHVLIARSGIDSDTDNPIRAALLTLLATTAGAVAGGYLGYRLDRHTRGAPNTNLDSNPWLSLGSEPLSIRFGFRF